MSLIWVNGTLVDKAEARVSPVDHGFLYGDGVWEHLRAFGGRLFRPADHLDQLFTAALSLDLTIPHTPAELTAAIEATLKANNRTDGYIRVIVTRGAGNLGPDPRKTVPQVLIIAEEYQPFPIELYGHGLHAVTESNRLDDSNPAHARRTLNQLHVVLAKRNALRRGCLEAVLVYAGGRAAGCTEGPLFVVRGREVRRLVGVDDAAGTAAAELAAGLGYAVTDDSPLVEDLHAADEVFVAGTACGVIGIVRLDGVDIGTGTEGPVTRAVRQAYHKLTRAEARVPHTSPLAGEVAAE